MAHVYAARALLPRMRCAAAVTFSTPSPPRACSIRSAARVYGVTKHAAVGFAENLAFTHADQRDSRLHPLPASGRYRDVTGRRDRVRSMSTAC